MCVVLRIFVLCLCLGQTLSDDDLISKYIGCFEVTPLHEYSTHVLYQFSPGKCFELCAGKLRRYAALLSKSFLCYCGDAIASKSKKEEDELCKRCANDPDSTCGGEGTVSLYHLTYRPPTDKVNLDILLAMDDTVALLDTSYGNYSILASPNVSVNAVDFHIRRQEGYASWDNKLHRFSLNGSGPVTYLCEMDYCVTFAVDWVHDWIYWPNCDITSAILITDLDGNHTDFLIKLPRLSGFIMDMVVDPYRGLLFWISSEQLMSCELDGRGLRTLEGIPLRLTISLTFLAVDPVAEMVFVLGNDHDTSFVYRGTYSGEEFVSIFKMHREFGLESLGVLRSHLYFTKDLPGNRSELLQGYISSALVTTEIKGVLTLNKTINHLKLVEMQLQSPGRIDACSNRGCSHHCVVQNSIGECRCPRVFALSDDGKTCERGNDITGMVFKGLGGLVCVLLVLFSAGVLMCLGDKLWSNIHPTVVRITELNVLHRQRQSQDDDNLI